MSPLARILATVLTALLAATFAPAAHADADGSGRYSYAESTVCVVRTDPAKTYRVGDAIRAWNAVQSYVHFSDIAVPGCGVLEVRQFDPDHARFPDYEGWADWPQWDQGVMDEALGKWTYHHAEVWVPTTPAAGKCYARWLLAHEMGHAMGLHHSGSNASVMSGTYRVDKFCGDVNPVDVEALGLLYG